jgi:uncharacterized repeat protein (TIGR03803 family)
MRTKLVAALAAFAAGSAGCHGIAQPGVSNLPSSDTTLPISGAAPTSEKVVYSFKGSPGGELPEAALIRDSAGGFYGVATRGGTGNACSGGCGTIFRLSQSASGVWSERTLHSFNLSDGAYPGDPLVADGSGNLYGTTEVGPNLGEAYGLFHAKGGWKLQILHKFHGGSDGAQPRSSMIFDTHGNLFGTTVAGGTGGSGGNGSVFELTPQSGSWKETFVHRFINAKNGTSPQAGAIFGSDGSLYGTTSYGGNTVCPAGCGVAYKLAPIANGGWRPSVLHAFDAVDGDTSVAPVVFDKAGNLYGSEDEGGHSGCFGGCGTIFELRRNGHGSLSFAVIHTFRVSDGGGPEGEMVVDSAGNLYGTTVVGGNIAACPQQRGCGVVFKLAPAPPPRRWTYSVLYVFNNSPDGALPTGLVMGADGNLYGTTIGGGSLGLGAVFEVTP